MKEERLSWWCSALWIYSPTLHTPPSLRFTQEKLLQRECLHPCLGSYSLHTLSLCLCLHPFLPTCWTQGEASRCWYLAAYVKEYRWSCLACLILLMNRRLTPYVLSCAGFWRVLATDALTVHVSSSCSKLIFVVEASKILMNAFPESKLARMNGILQTFTKLPLALIRTLAY